MLAVGLIFCPCPSLPHFQWSPKLSSLYPDELPNRTFRLNGTCLKCLSLHVKQINFHQSIWNINLTQVVIRSIESNNWFNQLYMLLFRKIWYHWCQIWISKNKSIYFITIYCSSNIYIYNINYPQSCIFSILGTFLE